MTDIFPFPDMFPQTFILPKPVDMFLKGIERTGKASICSCEVLGERAKRRYVPGAVSGEQACGM